MNHQPDVQDFLPIILQYLGIITLQIITRIWILRKLYYELLLILTFASFIKLSGISGIDLKDNMDNA